MSGHNKWSKIKDKKGDEDARGGKVFTKMARAVTVVVKEGGADLERNPSLKSVIEKVRAENIPNGNIDRVIKKASGDGDSANHENIVYEGHGPEGVAVIVGCLTDNRNRTASDVRHYFDEFGGNLGRNGSVSFMFQGKGLLLIDADLLDEKEVMMNSSDAGAEDLEADGEIFVINTAMEDFTQVRDTLLKKGYKLVKSDLVYEPSNYVKINDKSNVDKMEKLIDNLEDSDDVQQVSHNWDNE